jgi:hypothetical protein
MKVETNKELKVKLKGNDADNFKSALKKIADEQKTIGFKKSNLNEDELKVIQSLSDKVNGC